MLQISICYKHDDTRIRWQFSACPYILCPLKRNGNKYNETLPLPFPLNAVKQGKNKKLEENKIKINEDNQER